MAAALSPPPELLRAFLGDEPGQAAAPEALDGLWLVPSLGLSPASRSALAALALTQELQAMERAAASEAPSGEDGGEEAGDDAGASFCGYYRDRDVFGPGADALPEAARRAVDEARGALLGAARQLLAPRGAWPSGGAAPPCEAWLNVIRPGDHMRPHDHAGSLLSGVYYPRVPGPGPGPGRAAPDGRRAAEPARR
mmetsp:Transcript_3726/g.12420  ORF Transcript_3726/g.12420 Transcript_3726/m.12420 type:complete len:196 (-) Transcript_3726:13-600(-)